MGWDGTIVTVDVTSAVINERGHGLEPARNGAEGRMLNQVDNQRPLIGEIRFLCFALFVWTTYSM